MTDPTKQDRAWLALADGTVLEGRPFGARGVTTGEAVFTTTWTGYQEVLTDPSYYGQIVTMTAPRDGQRRRQLGGHRGGRRDAARCGLRGAGREPDRLELALPRSRSTRTSRVTASSASRTWTRGGSRDTCATTGRRTAPSGPRPRRAGAARPRGAGHERPRPRARGHAEGALPVDRWAAERGRSAPRSARPSATSWSSTAAPRRTSCAAWSTRGAGSPSCPPRRPRTTSWPCGPTASSSRTGPATRRP